MSFHTSQVEGFDHRSLHLIIIPTMNCNCRCPYCHEERANFYMDSETLLRLKKLISSRIKKLQSLHISWFGGEPLLAPETILDLSSFLKETADKNPGVRLTQDITTNGTLLSASIFNLLVWRGISTYQITLDGFRSQHDITRPHSVSYVSSFDMITENLLMMKESDHDFTMLLRCHLTRQNRDTYQDFIKWAERNFLDDRRFKIFMRPVSQLLPEQNKCAPVTDDIDIIEKAKEEITRKDSIFTLPEGFVCYAACSNAFAVAPDGTIGKCTVDAFDGVNRIGELTETGEVSIDRESLVRWLKPLMNGDINAAACPRRTIRAASISA